MTIDDQIFADLQELAARFPQIPEGAKTFEQISADFPTIPKSPLNKWVGKKVASGEWMKARRGNVCFYWPAK
jgi:hypothetical protein